ncbi:MAG: phosphoenolpyruvate--protein phosphotransferase [Lachnospiraceae bacterium]
MNTYSGKAAVQGIAVGRILELKKKSNIVRRERITDVEAEIERLTIAQAETMQQLQQLYDKAVKEVGEANAAIFEVHQMMLEDDDYVDSIHNIIRIQTVNAEYAIAKTGDNFAAMFAAMENNEYMNARAVDVKDISERLIQVLNHSKDSELNLTEKSIIVADDLVPSETLQLDKEKVLAFVMRQGSVNSHTAILARTMNIPALVNVPIPEGVNGKMAIVNGFKGSIIMEPNEQAFKEAENLQKDEAEKNKLLQEYKGKTTVTKSGKGIKLYANIGGVSDVGAVLQNDAEGIGLFRSEFLYLQEEGYPSEDKQFQAYKMVAEMMAGKKVIIRTLDIGADKQIDYFELEKEENPAMGYRAVRICLKREEVFTTQIRALLRASAFGNIAIMVPMIISVWEVKKVKEIMEKVKAELKNEGISFDNHMEFGIMIETPASVMIADELAGEVDFFSIGTNDLTQYTLAIDRQNPKLDMFYDPHHPAVLRMIRMTIESAHKAGIWAGICGELGADTELTSKFVEMGVDELSVTPTMILPVRKRICEME